MEAAIFVNDTKGSAYSYIGTVEHNNAEPDALKKLDAKILAMTRAAGWKVLSRHVPVPVKMSNFRPGMFKEPIGYAIPGHR